ncbi:complement C1q tumor necrosis factor-related protein 3-like isoform X3 [Ruditapes philippinarum]|uniref:complement C1q tumor necrosis factor-related protein 3-like isoform X3 n=1 Tax=Ruditapes philippinarum TaxID=129788 RepID=UPI00295B8221|nr:complement C1q tumor necrosis factor-related protein 3-like isoform X3 [Ruditapes philippinarum]
MTMLSIVLSLVLIFNINGITPSLASETSNSEINELKRYVEELKQTCDTRYKELEGKFYAHVSRRSISGGIAFSAQLSIHLSNIPIGTTINFDKVHVNDGAAYNNKTGVFIAPETGVYMFAYFIGHGRTAGQAWVTLKHNGQKINSAVTDTFHLNEDLQGGNMAILKLDVGDRVWIESFHSNNAYLDGPNAFSSFTGLYLYA